MIAPSDRKSKIWSVVRVSSGDFLEMYDFMVFGVTRQRLGMHSFQPASSLREIAAATRRFTRRQPQRANCSDVHWDDEPKPPYTILSILKDICARRDARQTVSL
jgi:hypothetical protein